LITFINFFAKNSLFHGLAVNASACDTRVHEFKSNFYSLKASSFRFVLDIVRRFPSSFRFVLNIVAHNVEGKSKNLQYLGVQIFSQILTILIVHSIQFFILRSKLSKFLKSNLKWRFYMLFCHGTILLEEEFLISCQKCEENVSTSPSSFRLVSHNVSGIPATLRLTMWPECEEFVSLNEDALCFERASNTRSLRS